MGGRGDVKYALTEETTVFDDVLMKHGIITKEQALLAKGLDVDSVATILVKDQLNDMGFFDEEEHEATLQERAENATSNEELDDLEDELSDDDKFMAEYREKRLADLRAQAAREKFGSVEEIAKVDWIEQVNKASEETWVICHLYQDSIEACGVMDAALVRLSRTFKDIKFVKIKSTSAIENFPDKNLPAVFCYRDGEMKHQIITLEKLGGLLMGLHDLEWHLHTLGVLTSSAGPPPRVTSKQQSVNISAMRRGRWREDDENAEEYEDDMEEYLNFK